MSMLILRYLRFPAKYVLIKSSVSFVLMYPKLEGVSFISRFFVDKYILPLLGMRKENAERVVTEPNFVFEEKSLIEPSFIEEDDGDDGKEGKDEDEDEDEDMETINLNTVNEIDEPEHSGEAPIIDLHSEGITPGTSNKSSTELNRDNMERSVVSCSDSTVSYFSYVDVDDTERLLDEKRK